MAITVQEIQEIGFEHSLRGYDVVQVDDFLEHVATEVGLLNDRVVELETELAEATSQLEHAQTEEALEEEVVEIDASEGEQMSLREQEMQAELAVAKECAESEAKRAKEAEAKVAQLEAQLAEKTKLDSAISEAFIAAQRSADQIREDARIEAARICKESEDKAQAYMSETLAKKAAIDNEVELLESSVVKFRNEYFAMLDRFKAQADAEFGGLEDLDVTEPAPQAAASGADPSATTASMSSVSAAAHSAAKPEEPRLTTEQIPKIVLPSFDKD